MLAIVHTYLHVTLFKNAVHVEFILVKADTTYDLARHT
jgi:hypothetical protein